MTFTEYLKRKKYSPATVHGYSQYNERFITWLDAENIDAAAFNYNHLLSFMQQANDQGITKRTLHSILCVIRHYCNYLIH